MQTKYNNDSQYYKDWTTEKLKQEAISLNDSIYVIECYGSRDVLMLMGITHELENRGIEVKTSQELMFNEEID